MTIPQERVLELQRKFIELVIAQQEQEKQEEQHASNQQTSETQ